MSELIVLDEVSPTEIFQGEGLNELLERIRVEASSFVPDVSSAKGRKEVASMAMKVSKCKTYLDGKGKDIVDALKKQPKLIDAKRKELREFLDELKANVRDPLTQWESIEAERIESHEANIREMLNAGIHARDDWQSIGLEAMEDRLKELEAEVIGENYDEFESEALLARNEAVLLTAAAIEKKTAAITEKEELEKLRADAVERETKGRAELLAQEAEDRMRIEAEQAKEKHYKSMIHHINQCALGFIGGEPQPMGILFYELEDKIIIDDSWGEFKQPALEAKKNAISKLKEIQESLSIKAKEKEQQDKIDEETRIEEAEERVKQQAKEEQQREQAEIAMREADTKHRGKINREAMAALVESGVDKDEAKKVITVIAKGMIPNVKINY